MTLETDTLTDAVASFSERLEYELRGAWRAGYAYVHVYGEPPGKHFSMDVSEDFTMRMSILPSNQRTPPRPETRQYRYTYDLESIPDAEIRSVINGRSVNEQLR